MEGAVLFCGNPSIVRAREADTTYGKSVIRTFDGDIHNCRHRKLDDDGNPKCHDLFQTIVEVGEMINPEYLYTVESVLLHHGQKNKYIEMYSSPEKVEEVWYVNRR